MIQNTPGKGGYRDNSRDKQSLALDMGWLEGASANEIAIAC